MRNIINVGGGGGGGDRYIVAFVQPVNSDKQADPNTFIADKEEDRETRAEDASARNP